MEISDDFINAVENRNILRVKLILKNSFIIDPTGETFNKLLEFTLNKIPDLFDKHDGELFKAIADKLFNKKVILPSSINYTNRVRQSYCKFITTRNIVGTSLAVVGTVWLGYIVIMNQISIVTALTSVAITGFGWALLFHNK